MSTNRADMSPATSEDEYHLHLLSIFHYGLAGLTALSGCAALIYVFIGFVMLAIGTTANRPEAIPMLVGLPIMMIGVLLFMVFQAIAIGQALNARYLQTHRHHTYCFVLAVIHCLSFPLGTVLGAFTILVLIRPSVRKLFGVA